MSKVRALAGHVKVRLVDSIRYKLIEVISCPLPREGDWVVRAKTLYRVQSVWFYNNRMPRVVLTPFPYPPPAGMR